MGISSSMARRIQRWYRVGRARVGRAPTMECWRILNKWTIHGKIYDSYKPDEPDGVWVELTLHASLKSSTRLNPGDIVMGDQPYLLGKHILDCLPNRPCHLHMSQIFRNLGGFPPMTHKEQVEFWHDNGYDFNPETGRAAKITLGLGSGIAAGALPKSR